MYSQPAFSLLPPALADVPGARLSTWGDLRSKFKIGRVVAIERSIQKGQGGWIERESQGWYYRDSVWQQPYGALIFVCYHGTLVFLAHLNLLIRIPWEILINLARSVIVEVWR